VPSDDLVLPERVVLLHIGPHKTGTTTVQSAFHHNRDALIAQGVRYAGHEQHSYLAARSAVGSVGVPGRRKPRPRAWRRLVEEVASSPQGRVVVSSEGFAGARDEPMSRLLGDLSASRPVHVVVTLRPLSKIAPSQWQQLVQNGQLKEYDEWLNDVFNDVDDRSIQPTFWQRHDHGTLVSRWAQAVGTENVTVIVVDDRDHNMLTRSFEGLLGLQPGTLVAPAAVANRSLTVAEIELVRRVNLEIRDELWDTDSYSQVMKDGVSDGMQINRRPGPDEIAITTPRWALERASRIGLASAKRISSLGVRIIGDIETLGDLPRESAIRADDVEMPTDIPLDAAVLAMIGAIHGMKRAIEKGKIGNQAPLESAPVEVKDQVVPVGELPSRDLLRAVADRGIKRVKQRLPRGAS
jgi:hypothetical protein